MDGDDALIDYAFLFPLISACHSKVKYTAAYLGEVQFKSEYIIPQLLLQWYKDNKLMIDGIRYLSCTAEDKFPGKDFSKFNYVVPAISISETGFCKNLVQNYSASPVYSFFDKDPVDLMEDSLNKITNAINTQAFTPII